MTYQKSLHPIVSEPLEIQKRFNIDLGREITWQLISSPLTLILLNEFNNRFSPDEALTEEEHEKAIKAEDPQAFENLKKSWECNPQFEQLVAYQIAGESKYRLIAGHRRFFAAKRTNSTSVLVWVAIGITADEAEHIRDWPEIHRTKVTHSTFFKNKAIYNDLRNRNDLERAKRISVWKQKGYSTDQVLKAERVFGRMVSFGAELGEKPENRITQTKAFEAYDRVCETTFKELLDRGEMDRVATLDKVAKAFLKHGLAHDDLKGTVTGMASLPANDPSFKAINEDPTYLDEVGNLRKLDALARALKSDGGSIVGEVREFTARLFSKLVSRAEVNEFADCVVELQDAVARLNSALLTIKSGGANEV